MNRRPKTPPPRCPPPAYRRAFEELDMALAEWNRRHRAALELAENLALDAQITRLRLALFGCAP